MKGKSISKEQDKPHILLQFIGCLIISFALLGLVYLFIGSLTPTTISVSETMAEDEYNREVYTYESFDPQTQAELDVVIETGGATITTPINDKRTIYKDGMIYKIAISDYHPYLKHDELILGAVSLLTSLLWTTKRYQNQTK